MNKTSQTDADRLSGTLTIRINLGSQDVRIGPGKIDLLERVGETGSIAAAGRALNMSYRRAWLLIDSLNQAFNEPVVIRRSGGSGGGGAELTELGKEIIQRYRRIESAASQASIEDRAALSALCRTKIKTNI